MSSHYKLHNLNQNKTFTIDRPALLIGRGEHCDLSLNDKDLSREHAKLFCSHGGLVIADLHSTNGTYVNHQRIQEPTHLLPNDKLKLGNIEFKIEYQELEQSEDSGTVLADASAVTRMSKNPKHYGLTNFLGLFPFLKQKHHHPHLEAYLASHKDSIERYHQYFKRQALGESGLLMFFYKDDHTLSVHCVTADHNQNLWSIGRSDTCYMIIDEHSVSKHHADLAFDNGHWYLRDCNSLNGIRNNGESVEHAELVNESDIRLGDVKLYTRLIK